MKKRLISFLLLCMLLCGCSANPSSGETTSLPDTTATEAAATTPQGFYAPGSTLETETGGAVRVYPLRRSDVSGFLVLGQDLVLFSGSETTTTLTLLSGETMYPAATVELDFVLTVQNYSLRLCGSGFSFFDPLTNETVVMDSSLREISRIPAPADMVNLPLLSADRSTLYYCTATAIRAWDLETGIRRVLKEIAYPSQSVTGLLLEDSVLACSISDSDYDTNTLYISTETGATLSMTSDIWEITASDSQYYAIVPIGATQSLVFGQPNGTSMELLPKKLSIACSFLPGTHGAVLHRLDEEYRIVLDYYDLETGRCISSLPLSTQTNPWSIQTDANGFVYFLNFSETYDSVTLYRWDPAALPANDPEVYTAVYYTEDNPDLAGLADCQLYADEIGSRYGIRVLVAGEATAVQPWDYDMEAEYRVSVIRQELEQLDAHLSNYPESMLQTLAERFEGLNICIVRQLTGTPESGSLDTASGIQFWEDFGAYIALAVGMETEHALYHELCHLIDTVVLNESSAYDRWDELNPSGFEYDYNYITNAQRDASAYLQENTRYFIDTYSMSYPKEDRARIMEYAMTEGNESLFQSTTMQAKLKLLCVGIREAFGLKKSPDTFLWEQYLKESLAYVE